LEILDELRNVLRAV